MKNLKLRRKKMGKSKKKESKLTQGIIRGYQPKFIREPGEEPIKYTIFTVYPIYEDNDEPIEVLFYSCLPDSDTHRKYILGKYVDITEVTEGFFSKTLIQRAEVVSRNNSDKNYTYAVRLPLSKAKRIERYHKSRTG